MNISDIIVVIYGTSYYEEIALNEGKGNFKIYIGGKLWSQN